MLWLRNKKNNFQLRTLIWGPDVVIKLSVSPHEQLYTYVFMVMNSFSVYGSAVAQWLSA